MIGIIGGSGLEDPKLLDDAKEVIIESKYGAHSPIVTGKINGIDVAIMSRHGYKHEFTPCTIPYRANINAL
ncbi:MAG: S-methyl-5'-thioadenosine phosphorylase, partial [archaeon]